MRDRSSTFDVAVVGGGVIGLSVAWRAAQRGMRVIVLERAEPGGGASWVREYRFVLVEGLGLSLSGGRVRVAAPRELAFVG